MGESESLYVEQMDVHDGVNGVIMMRDEIQGMIAYTRAFADEMRVDLTRGIENLTEIVGSYTSSIDDIDTSIPTLDRPSFPIRPVFDDLSLDFTWPDKITAPNLTEYGDLDFEFTAPVAPEAIDESFDWSGNTYSSEMWSALFNKTHTDILSGGTGISDEAHEALVDRAKEAGRVSRDVEYRRAVDSVGANGFNLPSGQIASVVLAVHAENVAKDQDTLNTITIKDFELAQSQGQFAITSGTDLERLLRTTFDASEQRSFEASKAAKDYILQVYNENVKLYLAKWDEIKIRLDAVKAKVDAITSRNDGLIKAYMGQTSAFETEINAIVAKNTGMIDVRKSQVELYGTEVKAVAVQYASLAEEIKVRMDQVRTEVTLAIDEEKLNLTAYSDKAKLAETVASGVANISSQAVASALGAINTSLSDSYSGSRSVSESWGHGESLGETHSYAHDPVQ